MNTVFPGFSFGNHNTVRTYYTIIIIRRILHCTPIQVKAISGIIGDRYPRRNRQRRNLSGWIIVISQFNYGKIVNHYSSLGSCDSRNRESCFRCNPLHEESAPTPIIPTAQIELHATASILKTSLTDNGDADQVRIIIIICAKKSCCPQSDKCIDSGATVNRPDIWSKN